jgi:hypothetical protein
VAYFELSRATPLPVPESWARITDWPRHSASVPLTRVWLAGGGESRVGALVLARTGLGPLGFEDPMEIVLWQPPEGGGPGRCRLRKRGRVVRGWAELEALPTGTGSTVLWREEVRPIGLPAAADALVARVAARTFGAALDMLLSQVS